MLTGPYHPDSEGFARTIHFFPVKSFKINHMFHFFSLGALDQKTEPGIRGDQWK